MTRLPSERRELHSSCSVGRWDISLLREQGRVVVNVHKVKKQLCSTFTTVLVTIISLSTQTNSSGKASPRECRRGGVCKCVGVRSASVGALKIKKRQFMTLLSAGQTSWVRVSDWARGGEERKGEWECVTHMRESRESKGWGGMEWWKRVWKSERERERGMAKED